MTRIEPYIGYGSAQRIRLQGRVLEESRLIPSELANTAWKNVRNLYQRFGTEELHGVRVRARWNESTIEAVTDDDGYFRLDFAPSQPPGDGEWHQVALTLPDFATLSHGHGPVMAKVHLPAATARFGVISDLDDTVLKTNVASRTRMLANVAFRNARTRIPFPGVAAFYRALRSGGTGADANPLFYVSSCPWNLFDLLAEFFRIHDIPLGPMLLRDYRLKTLLFPGEPNAHKLAGLRALLDFYPSLPFVLIGDSGERDPEIYAEIVRAYPGRIPVIYIRDIASRRPRVAAALETLASEVRAQGSELVLVRDTERAARHAAGLGLILPDALSEIRSTKRADSRRRDDGK